MYCNNLWQRLITFCISFYLGLFAIYLNQNNLEDKKNSETIVDSVFFVNVVSAKEISEIKFKNDFKEKNKPFYLTFKPKATYTDLGKQNQIEGEVIIKVEFLANGKVGKMKPIKFLPFGLTEQALVVAREIQFQPLTKNGIAMTVTKEIHYSFSLQ